MLDMTDVQQVKNAMTMDNFFTLCFQVSSYLSKLFQ
jgi:hypothetical protein